MRKHFKNIITSTCEDDEGNTYKRNDEEELIVDQQCNGLRLTMRYSGMYNARSEITLTKAQAKELREMLNKFIEN